MTSLRVQTVWQEFAMRLAPFLAAATCMLFTPLVQADAVTTLALNGSLAGGGSVTGTLLLDTTQSSITSGQFTVTYGTTTDMISGTPFPNQQPGYLEETFSSALAPDGSIGLLLYLPVTTLSGYQGSAVCSLTVFCGPGIATYVVEGGPTGAAVSSQTLTSGSVSITPEPSSFVLFGTGLLCAAGAARRRFATHRT